MTDEINTEEESPTEEAPLAAEFIPKKPSRLCPRGIQTFTVARPTDETSIF